MINEVTSSAISTATDSEPDFGNFLAGGKIRKLGSELRGRSDAWFTNGGYTQTQFPQQMISGVGSLMNLLHLISILVFIGCLLKKNLKCHLNGKNKLI